MRDIEAKKQNHQCRSAFKKQIRIVIYSIFDILGGCQQESYIDHGRSRPKTQHNPILQDFSAIFRQSRLLEGCTDRLTIRGQDHVICRKIDISSLLTTDQKIVFVRIFQTRQQIKLWCPIQLSLRFVDIGEKVL